MCGRYRLTKSSSKCGGLPLRGARSTCRKCKSLCAPHFRLLLILHSTTIDVQGGTLICTISGFFRKHHANDIEEFTTLLGRHPQWQTETFIFANITDVIILNQACVPCLCRVCRPMKRCQSSQNGSVQTL